MAAWSQIKLLHYWQSAKLNMYINKLSYQCTTRPLHQNSNFWFGILYVQLWEGVIFFLQLSSCSLSQVWFGWLVPSPTSSPTEWQRGQTVERYFVVMWKASSSFHIGAKKFNLKTIFTTLILYSVIHIYSWMHIWPRCWPGPARPDS